MEPNQELLLTLIRHVKDMFIISQLYAPEEASDQIEVLLEEAATKIALWQQGQKPRKVVDRG